MQEALADIHGLWKRLLEACIGWGWAEACPLGLAAGGTGEFGEDEFCRVLFFTFSDMMVMVMTYDCDDDDDGDGSGRGLNLTLDL